MPGRRVLIAVCGGIAAYKTAALVSGLVQEGAQVRVAMTKAAQAFVGPTTFSALSGHPVATSLYHEPGYPLGPHIELPRWAEFLCVAPATANFLAKAAGGLADDLVSTLYLACGVPVLLAPAMNTTMWNQPAVRRNVDALRGDGVHLVDPSAGWLSCRDVGAGRMAEPAEIQSALAALFAAHPPNHD